MTKTEKKSCSKKGKDLQTMVSNLTTSIKKSEKTRSELQKAKGSQATKAISTKRKSDKQELTSKLVKTLDDNPQKGKGTKK